jgi:toxin CptA
MHIYESTVYAETEPVQITSGNTRLPIITLSPSRQLVRLLALAHFFTLAVIWFLPISFFWRSGLMCITVGSFVFYLQRDAKLALKNAVVALKWMPDNTLEIQQRSGVWLPAQIQPGGFVADYLTLVAYRLDGQRFTRHIVILPDMLEVEAFRDLRVRLRWKKTPPTPVK